MHNCGKLQQSEFIKGYTIHPLISTFKGGRTYWGQSGRPKQKDGPKVLFNSCRRAAKTLKGVGS